MKLKSIHIGFATGGSRFHCVNIIGTCNSIRGIFMVFEMSNNPAIAYACVYGLHNLKCFFAYVFWQSLHTLPMVQLTVDWDEIEP